MGPHHGQDVRRIGDGAVDHIDDVGLLQGRDHLHGHFQVLCQPVQVSLKELLPETWRDGRVGAPWRVDRGILSDERGQRVVTFVFTCLNSHDITALETKAGELIVSSY